MKLYASGAWRDVDSAKVRVGSAWKTVTSIKVYVSGAWKAAKVFSDPLTVSVSPDLVIDDVTAPVAYTSGSVTATPTGGRGPFTYSWTLISGDTGFAINSPSSAVTTFSRTILTEDSFTSEFQCAVTDADGNTESDTVSLNVNAFSGL